MVHPTRALTYLVTATALAVLVFGTPGDRDPLGRPLEENQCPAEDAQCPAARLWTLWWEDEVYEDCDDPAFGGALPMPSLPRACHDQYARGPGFETRAGCDSMVRLLRQRMPVMADEDMVCAPVGTHPDGHPD
jgi:hypothetical protein